MGPAQISYMSCVSCAYSCRYLVQDGPDPEYEYYCKHPNFFGAAEYGRRTTSLGRVVGFDEKTPKWCPESQQQA